MDRPEQAGTDPMGIGDFARASGLTPKALRLYDEMGLLLPASVDPTTGYRSYVAGQLPRARLVARLRLAGMPLARIGVVADLPSRAAAAELTSYWRQVEADTASARRLVASLVTTLHEQEDDMSPTTPTGSTTGSATGSTTGHPRIARREGIGARETQQDATLVGTRVVAVADGFGDAPGLAEDALAELVGPDGLDGAGGAGPDPLGALDAALARAAGVVTRRYADRPGAGTTVTALVLDDERMFLAHVGDSRAYRLRAGRLERLTRDHTVAQTLVDEGRLSAEEARADDRRVQLNRAVALDAPHEPDLAVHGTLPGDRYVLCTDGVHGEVAPADLTDLLSAASSPQEVVDAVALAVEATGADDNYAVVVLDLPG